MIDGLLGQQGSILRAKYTVTQNMSEQDLEIDVTMMTINFTRTRDGMRREILDLNLNLAVRVSTIQNLSLISQIKSDTCEINLKTCQNALKLS